MYIFLGGFEERLVYTHANLMNGLENIHITHTQKQVVKRKKIM